MGSIDRNDVIQILKIVGQSDIDELRLEMGGVKLFLKKSAAASIGGREDSARSDASPVASAALEDRAVDSREMGEVLAEKGEGPGPIGATKETGYTPIKAPLLGTFYRAPKPDAPPFVKEGQFVAENDTLCIIEVMKLFNTVKAGIRGIIKEICAEDGKLVEFDQTLFWMEADPEGKLTEAEA